MLHKFCCRFFLLLFSTNLSAVVFISPEQAAEVLHKLNSAEPTLGVADLEIFAAGFFRWVVAEEGGVKTVFLVMAHILKAVCAMQHPKSQYASVQARLVLWPPSPRADLDEVKECPELSSQGSVSSVASAASSSGGRLMVSRVKLSSRAAALRAQCQQWLCRQICTRFAGVELAHSYAFIIQLRLVLDALPPELWPSMPATLVKHVCGDLLATFIFGDGTKKTPGRGFASLTADFLAALVRDGKGWVAQSLSLWVAALEARLAAEIRLEDASKSSSSVSGDSAVPAAAASPCLSLSPSVGVRPSRLSGALPPKSAKRSRSRTPTELPAAHRGGKQLTLDNFFGKIVRVG
jgi:hypothetical protein